jgi:hypothetical protein
MIKLFGFVKARGAQPARLVRVEATDRMPREELRRKLIAISARKQRTYGGAQATGKAPDEQPPSRSQHRRPESGARPLAVAS